MITLIQVQIKRQKRYTVHYQVKIKIWYFQLLIRDGRGTRHTVLGMTVGSPTVGHLFSSHIVG